jgi:hypothetical protein
LFFCSRCSGGGDGGGLVVVAKYDANKGTVGEFRTTLADSHEIPNGGFRKMPVSFLR